MPTFQIPKRWWPLPVAAVTCAIPYFALLGLLTVGHRDASTIVRPEGSFLTAVAVLGGVASLTALLLSYVHVIRDTSRFQPVTLAALYVGLLLVFASLYSLLQCTSASAAFAHAPRLWASDTGLSLAEHVERLHSVFGTMIYLSTITMTTVGYGDITPVSTPARMLIAIQSLCGISFVSVAVGHYFAVCSRRC